MGGGRQQRAAALMRAVRANDAAEVTALVGAQPAAQRTPPGAAAAGGGGGAAPAASAQLAEAVRLGHVRCAALLVGAGHALDGTAPAGETALDWAAYASSRAREAHDERCRGAGDARGAAGAAGGGDLDAADGVQNGGERGTNYQLGTGLSSVESVPQEYHSAAVTARGELYTWGWARGGRLGHGAERGDAADAHAGAGRGGEAAVVLPRLVAALARVRVVSVAAGKHHTLAIVRRPMDAGDGASAAACGEVWSWGGNAHGQLGAGGAPSADEACPVPRRVERLRGTQCNCVCAANKHSAAVTVAGALYTWGSNASGQLGYTTAPAGAPATAPRAVDALRDRRVTHVSTAKHHTLCVAGSRDGGGAGRGVADAAAAVLMGGGDGGGLTGGVASASFAAPAPVGGSGGSVFHFGHGRPAPRRLLLWRAMPDGTRLRLRVKSAAAGAGLSAALCVGGYAMYWASDDVGGRDGSVASAEVPLRGAGDERVQAVEVAAGKTRISVTTERGDVWVVALSDEGAARGRRPRGGASQHASAFCSSPGRSAGAAAAFGTSPNGRGGGELYVGSPGGHENGASRQQRAAEPPSVKVERVPRLRGVIKLAVGEKHSLAFTASPALVVPDAYARARRQAAAGPRVSIATGAARGRCERARLGGDAGGATCSADGAAGDDDESSEAEGDGCGGGGEESRVAGLQERAGREARPSFDPPPLKSIAAAALAAQACPSNLPYMAETADAVGLGSIREWCMECVAQQFEMVLLHGGTALYEVVRDSPLFAAMLETHCAMRWPDASQSARDAEADAIAGAAQGTLGASDADTGAGASACAVAGESGAPAVAEPEAGLPRALHTVRTKIARIDELEALFVSGVTLSEDQVAQCAQRADLETALRVLMIEAEAAGRMDLLIPAGDGGVSKAALKNRRRRSKGKATTVDGVLAADSAADGGAAPAADASSVVADSAGIASPSAKAGAARVASAGTAEASPPASQAAPRDVASRRADLPEPADAGTPASRRKQPRKPKKGGLSMFLSGELEASERPSSVGFRDIQQAQASNEASATAAAAA
eukprot:PRCOL_00005253-RA